MTTWAISLKVPPPLDHGLDDQEEALLTGLKPFLESLPDRPPTRAGNVLAFDLLSAEGMRQANSYLLLVTVDNPADKTLGRLAEEIVTVLPDGSTASVLGEFDSVARSSEPKAHA
ncbi:hypothetical protein P3H80_16990 [Mycolicibacterium septicum]|uniref:hypothetical protein n=1 Tax=Mycolicibacterium septicum TaxID=98668 RepID=UPI0023E0C17A|nr:hypothetical protein [Mycolicibacterium septicum]MDF3339135.1 hypothetical protein [Mycolicibacterium septicum]